MAAVFVPYFVVRGLLSDPLRLRNPATRYRQHRRQRGMSVGNDWRDWLGGYPNLLPGVYPPNLLAT